MAVYSEDVQKIYIAYYGRPADAVGLAFWESQLEATGGNLSAIIGSFGASPEFDARFGGLSDSSLISNIYQQLFGRDPDAGGLAFYLAELQAERMTLQSISIAVLNGSQNNDLNIINNKTAASTLFTSSLANGKFKYEGSAAANSASTWLAKIDETYTTEMLTTSTFVFISRPLASTTIPEMSINYDAFISQNDGSVAETVTLDFNSDGLLDVLVVSGQYLTTNGTKIEIALSNGDGTFLDGTSNIITGDIPEFLHPREIVQDDFNGDSITDFYIVGHGYDASPFPGEPNALLLSNVDGTWANSPIPTEKDFTHSATSGDIDNDGDIDIYVGNIFGGDRIPPYTLINDGVGEFTKSSSILPVTLKNLKVVFTTSLLFDANNDGWGDIVVGGNENIGNKIFLNNQGGFSDSSVINLPESTRFSTNIVVDSQTYDFNNDGILDILFLSTKGSPFYEENQIQILINDGLANFTDESDTYIPNYLQYQDIWSNYVHIVDINDDSYKDLLLGRTGTYYLNDGSGIFSTSGTIPQLKWGDYEVVNIDSDTQSEIVFQHHQAGLGVMDFM